MFQTSESFLKLHAVAMLERKYREHISLLVILCINATNKKIGRSLIQTGVSEIFGQMEIYIYIYIYIYIK